MSSHEESQEKLHMMETKLLGKLGETTQLTKGLTSRESLLEAGKVRGAGKD